MINVLFMGRELFLIYVVATRCESNVETTTLKFSNNFNESY